MGWSSIDPPSAAGARSEARAMTAGIDAHETPAAIDGQPARRADSSTVGSGRSGQGSQRGRQPSFVRMPALAVVELDALDAPARDALVGRVQDDDRDRLLARSERHGADALVPESCDRCGSDRRPIIDAQRSVAEQIGDPAVRRDRGHARSRAEAALLERAIGRVEDVHLDIARRVERPHEVVERRIGQRPVEASTGEEDAGPVREPRRRGVGRVRARGPPRPSPGRRSRPSR